MYVVCIFNVCMYVCMYVCYYVCMFIYADSPVCMYALPVLSCMYAFHILPVQPCPYVCMPVWRSLCMYVCTGYMFVCMYICVCVAVCGPLFARKHLPGTVLRELVVLLYTTIMESAPDCPNTVHAEVLRTLQRNCCAIINKHRKHTQIHTYIHT